MAPFTRRQIIALGLVTLSSRFLVAWILGVAGTPETWEYDDIAANLVGGAGHMYNRGGFVYAAYAPPLWSLVLAGLLILGGGSLVMVQLAQGLFCFASAIVYGSLARRLSGSEGVGLLTSFLVALQPSLLYYSVVKSDPLPLNVLLLGSIVLVGRALIEAPALSRAAWFGLLVALGVLARGTPIVVLPLVAAGLLIRWRRRAVGPILVAVTGLLLGLAPWLIRNDLILGRAVLTTTAGENFWRGNHPGATGGVKDENGGLITSLNPSNEALPESIREVLQTGTEIDRQDVFMNEGLKFIRGQPAGALALLARKMRTFWWRIDSDPADYSPAASITYQVIYRIELTLALFGVLVVFRSRPVAISTPDRVAAALALGLMVGISLLQSAFYVQGRHRFLIEPLLLIFTAVGITHLAQRVASTAYRSERQSGS